MIPKAALGIGTRSGKSKGEAQKSDKLHHCHILLARAQDRARLTTEEGNHVATTNDTGKHTITPRNCTGKREAGRKSTGLKMARG